MYIYYNNNIKSEREELVMEYNKIITANIDRFSGFSKIYNRSRPATPRKIIDIAVESLGRTPELVVDLGSGTGLSTKLWNDIAVEVIGVEPNEEMRLEAERINKFENIKFINGLSNNIPLLSGEADIITCSQSFHWMEPKSTLKEIGRVLKPGGVLLIYNCHWPPIVNIKIDEKFKKLINKAEDILKIKENEVEKAKKWNKSEHTDEMKKSGEFKFVKEITIQNKVIYSNEKFIDLALSFGGVQTVMKKYNEDIQAYIEEFKQNVYEEFGDKAREIVFYYSIRIGIK